MLGEPLDLADVDSLRQWALNRVRFGQKTTRWLLMPPDGSRPPKLEGKENVRYLSQELYARLAARWPTQRNGGRSYLTPCGIFDLVGHSGPLRAEGERLARLDAAKWARVGHLENRAEDAFGVVERVPELRWRRGADNPDHTCGGRWGAWSSECTGCTTADRAARRALDRARRWLDQVPEGADPPLTPRQRAEENDEGLALALFWLEGATGVPATPLP